MIFTIIFYVFGSVLSSLAWLLDYITVLHWPDALTDAITYFTATMMTLNSFLPIYEAMAVVEFVVIFFSSYYLIRIIIALITERKVHI